MFRVRKTRHNVQSCYYYQLFHLKMCSKNESCNLKYTPKFWREVDCANQFFWENEFRIIQYTYIKKLNAPTSSSSQRSPTFLGVHPPMCSPEANAILEWSKGAKINGGFQKWGYPKEDGLWKIPIENG